MLVAQVGTGAALLRHGVSLFSRLGWLEEVMVTELKRWMVLSVCSAKVFVLRQRVCASMKRLEAISCVAQMTFTLQCTSKT